MWAFVRFLKRHLKLNVSSILRGSNISIFIFASLLRGQWRVFVVHGSKQVIKSDPLCRMVGKHVYPYSLDTLIRNTLNTDEMFF